MTYKDFRPNLPRYLTRINHETYMRTTPAAFLSPWRVLPGWSLESCLHDMMHVVYLGTARDLIPSLLGDFLECGVLGSPDLSVDYRLKLFSIEMNRFFTKERLFGQFSMQSDFHVYLLFLWHLGMNPKEFCFQLWFLGVLGLVSGRCTSRQRTQASQQTLTSLNWVEHGKQLTSKWYLDIWPLKPLNLQLKLANLTLEWSPNCFLWTIIYKGP